MAREMVSVMMATILLFIFCCHCMQPRPWNEEDMKGLVKYLRCRSQNDTWPAAKSSVRNVVYNATTYTILLKEIEQVCYI